MRCLFICLDLPVFTPVYVEGTAGLLDSPIFHHPLFPALQHTRSPRGFYSQSDTSLHPTYVQFPCYLYCKVVSLCSPVHTVILLYYRTVSNLNCVKHKTISKCTDRVAVSKACTVYISRVKVTLAGVDDGIILYRVAHYADIFFPTISEYDL